MRKIIVAAAAAAVSYAAGVRAADRNPADVQDPPGAVDVNQPADVSIDERNTNADTTDTLHGARTEVIESAPDHAQAQHGGMQWREVQPGREARASFDETQAQGEPAARNTDPMPGTVYSNDTWLGTDQGYGTGTEPARPPAR